MIVLHGVVSLQWSVFSVATLVVRGCAREVPEVAHLRALIVLWCLVGIVAARTQALGQQTDIIQKRILASRVLAGHVQAGSIPEGLKNVRVELCDAEWKTAIQSTLTDDDGNFSFSGVPQMKVYGLRLSSPGIDTLFVRVK